MNPLYGKMDLGAGQRAMVEARWPTRATAFPRRRTRALHPFFTTKEKGLGLGLAICHRILEEHRGAIQVDQRARARDHGLLLPSDRALSGSCPLR